MVPQLAKSTLTLGALIGALVSANDGPRLANPSVAVTGNDAGDTISLMFYHRQQLSAWTIDDDDGALSDAPSPLTEPSYAPFPNGLTILAGAGRTADAPLTALDWAQVQGITRLAVDLDWRDREGRSRLRCSKWAFDLK